MTPKLCFKYSRQYDLIFKERFIQNFEYPSFDITLSRINEARTFEKNNSQVILDEISNQSGLDWYTSEIHCYVVGYCVPFSSPLTMPTIFKRDNSFEQWRDILIHEIIHIILSDQTVNKPDFKKKITEEFKHENTLTIEHIAVHSILEKVLTKLYGVKRIENDKLRCKNFLPEEYSRAWDIVEDIGADEVIDRYLKV